jgi:hypothetical protein
MDITVRGIEAGIARQHKIGTPVPGKKMGQRVTEAQHAEVKRLLSQTIKRGKQAKGNGKPPKAAPEGLRERLEGEALRLEERAKTLRAAAGAL